MLAELEKSLLQISGAENERADGVAHRRSEVLKLLSNEAADLFAEICPLVSQLDERGAELAEERSFLKISLEFEQLEVYALEF